MSILYVFYTLTVIALIMNIFLMISITGIVFFNKRLNSLIQKFKRTSEINKRFGIRRFSLFRRLGSDYLLIVFTLFVFMIGLFFIHTKTDGEILKKFQIILQFFGICLAFIASIIGFKNYRRKSGNAFVGYVSYTSGPITQIYVSCITLTNLKDKSVDILSINLAFDNQLQLDLIGEREAVKLGPFESKKIFLEPPTIYSKSLSEVNVQNLFQSNEDIINRELIVKTYEGSYIVKSPVILRNKMPLKNIQLLYRSFTLNSGELFDLPCPRGVILEHPNSNYFILIKTDFKRLPLSIAFYNKQNFKDVIYKRFEDSFREILKTEKDVLSFLLKVNCFSEEYFELEEFSISFFDKSDIFFSSTLFYSTFYVYKKDKKRYGITEKSLRIS